MTKLPVYRSIVQRTHLPGETKARQGRGQEVEGWRIAYLRQSWSWAPDIPALSPVQARGVLLCCPLLFLKLMRVLILALSLLLLLLLLNEANTEKDFFQACIQKGGMRGIWWGICLIAGGYGQEGKSMAYSAMINLLAMGAESSLPLPRSACTVVYISVSFSVT